MARPLEIHFTHRVRWLRAAVLGADDGIVSGRYGCPRRRFIRVEICRARDLWGALAMVLTAGVGAFYGAML